MHTKTSQITASVEKAVASSDGTFVLSSTSFDRDDDRILESALKAVPASTPKLITLWQHKSDQPIGWWENIRFQGNKLLGDLRLASTNLSLMVKQLLDEKVPLGASIGFMGAGTFNKNNGIDYHTIELLECSIVSVPANPDAVRIAKQFGFSVKSVGSESTDIQPLLQEAESRLSDPALVSATLVNARRAIAHANLLRKKS